MKQQSFSTLAALLLCATASAQSARPTSYKFDFGPGAVAPGYTQVLPSMPYSAERGFGFDSAPEMKAIDRGGDPLKGDLVSSDKPFFFSTALPEGNYKVTITFGDPQAASDTTVNAELRRLMVQELKTESGKQETRSFIVNIRTPAIKGSEAKVRITGRESGQEIWAWDDRLTLGFLGSHPSIASMEIEKIEVPTIYLIGDSTVCDQDREPFNSWGQMFTRFIKPTVAVSNHAESGESVGGALGKGRFNKIFAEIKKGDYLLMQFGHNDMKATQEGAFDTFKKNAHWVVDEARAEGATMVLFTPVSRRTFSRDGTYKITNSFVTAKGDDYAGAFREIAKEKNVPLIDLQSASAAFYESMGDEKSHVAFATQAENTHHGNYGSYQIAKCVVQLIRNSDLDLKKLIVDDFVEFNPNHPDPFEAFTLPKSPLTTTLTPPGS